jgi:hypothetical protein
LEDWTTLGRRDRALAITVFVACGVFLIAQLIMPFRISNLLLTYFLSISEIIGLWLISNRYRRTRRREELLIIIAMLILHLPASLLVLQFQQILPTWIAPQSMRFISTPTVVSGLVCLMLRRYQSTESLKLKVAQAQAGESEALLAVLRFQLNPHMLLNSLTAISTLSRINPERVPALIDCLSGIIHSRLKPPPGAFWKLDEELHLVRSLVAIANVRFGDGLICEESIDPQTADCLIPDLLLQPLAENALKYGRLIDGFPFVSISTSVAQSKLNVKIINFVSDGEYDASVKSLRIGMANIRSRLDMLYGAEAELGLNYTGNHVIAEISLPICRQH